MLDTIPFTRTAAPSLSMAIFHRLVLVCVLLIFFGRSFVRFDIFCCLSFLPLLLLLLFFSAFFLSRSCFSLDIYIYIFFHIFSSSILFIFVYDAVFDACIVNTYARPTDNTCESYTQHRARSYKYHPFSPLWLWHFFLRHSVCFLQCTLTEREKDNFLLCFMRSLENLIFSDYLFFFLFFLFLL